MMGQERASLSEAQGAVAMLRTPENQGLPRGQGFQIQYTYIAQFEGRCFTFKRSIRVQPGGQMSDDNGTRLSVPSQHVEWVSSARPSPCRFARPHTAAPASPTAVVFPLLLSISAAASYPKPPLVTGLLLLPGRRPTY